MVERLRFWRRLGAAVNARADRTSRTARARASVHCAACAGCVTGPGLDLAHLLRAAGVSPTAWRKRDQEKLRRGAAQGHGLPRGRGGPRPSASPDRQMVLWRTRADLRRAGNGEGDLLADHGLVVAVLANQRIAAIGWQEHRSDTGMVSTSADLDQLLRRPRSSPGGADLELEVGSVPDRGRGACFALGSTTRGAGA